MLTPPVCGFQRPPGTAAHVRQPATSHPSHRRDRAQITPVCMPAPGQNPIPAGSLNAEIARSAQINSGVLPARYTTAFGFRLPRRRQT